MPAPRPSQSAEAARAAAAQAEFNEKKWVWVPDDKDGYLAGWVASEQDDIGDIVMAAGGEVRYSQSLVIILGYQPTLPTDPQGPSIRPFQDEPSQVR